MLLVVFRRLIRSIPQVKEGYYFPLQRSIPEECQTLETRLLVSSLKINTTRMLNAEKKSISFLLNDEYQKYVKRWKEGY